jgi:hypothetical protein
MKKTNQPFTVRGAVELWFLSLAKILLAYDFLTIKKLSCSPSFKKIIHS